MADLFFVGDAAFNESDHPRDGEGKFSSTGGGAAGSSPENAVTNTKTNLNWQVAKVFSDHGLKKVKGADLPTFIAPDGTKIIVHPTPGQKSSSKWAAHKPGAPEPEKGSGHQALGALIAKLTGQSSQTPTEAEQEAFWNPPEKNSMGEQPQEEPEQSSLPSHIANAYKNWAAGGYKKDAEKSGPFDYFRNEDGSSFKIDPVTENWGFFTDFGENTTGSGLFNLSSKIADYSGQSDEDEEEFTPDPTIIEPQPQPAKPSPSHHLPGVALAKFAEASGFKHSDNPESGVTIWSKPDGSKLQFNSETGDWIAQSPGHLTKEGSGAENLQKLFSGQPAIIPPGGKAPWANSSKTIQTKAEATKNVEAKKWSANHYEKYKKIKAAAPQPTSSQAAAIASYSGSSYQHMNNALRHDPKKLANDPKIKALDEYLNNATFPEEFVVERGVSGEYSKILKSILHEGGSFMDRGYVSTSGREGGGWSGLKMKITCPKGSKGASIAAWSQHSGEDEILLPRNSIFKVVKMEEGDFIHLEYQGPKT